MSEAAEFSPKDLKGWLEEETRSIFVPVQTKAERLLDKTREASDDLLEVSKMLLDNSGREIEKRNKKTYRRARALNRLSRLFVDRHRQLMVPNTVSYGSIDEFVKTTRKAFAATDIDVRKWFPRVSPFFILDRRKFQVIFEKAKRSLMDLQAFLEKEYVKTKTLEDTFDLIDELLRLEEELADCRNKMERVEADRASIEKKIDEIEYRTANLRNNESLANLKQTNLQIQKLRKELKNKIRHLQKPFLKFDRMLLRTGGLTPEELRKLDQYMKNPFVALASEKSGYPLLKKILQKLGDAISENKLKLKRDKKRKAEEAIARIVNEDSLDAIQKKCKDAVNRKTDLSASTEVTTTQQELLRTRKNLQRLLKKKQVAKTEEESTRRTFDDIEGKITRHKDEIERNTLNFLDKKIEIK